MTEKSSDLPKIRKLVTTQGYDFLSNKITNEIKPDSADIESRLLFIFENATRDMTQLSVVIEDEIRTLQQSALAMEGFLLDELDNQGEKLELVENAVDQVKADFQTASDGAVRVGGKLASTERERLNVKCSIELMDLVKQFQAAPLDQYSNVVNMNAQRLKESLPPTLQEQDWGNISSVLYDLKKILAEVNVEEVSHAQEIVINISEVVETELLGQFDSILDQLMEDQTNLLLITQAKSLAECLHLFNNGMTLHKRYIFSVIEKRIPHDAFLTRAKDSGANLLINTVKKVFRTHNNDGNGGDNSDDGSSAGASDNDDEPPPTLPQVNTNHNNYDHNALTLIDHLSSLFTVINKVCLEQFAIIREVFPVHTIPRITRQLVQRIFNDPAFGIQARVDAILNPQPPAPKLALSDYLDALVTVREKLSALNMLLQDCASDPAMMGMGSEILSMRKAKSGSKYRQANNNKIQEASGGEGQSTSGTRAGATATPPPPEIFSLLDDTEISEERLRSDAEIRDFLYEQSAQVLSTYITSYFDKEMHHVRNQYVTALRRAVEDFSQAGKVSAGTVLQLPQIKAERMKSIPQLVNTVANKAFLNNVFTATTDSIVRMESIGRDDKKLAVHMKDLYLLQLGFLAEGLMLPWSKASTTMLLKIAGSKGQYSQLPPQELLPSLAALTYGKHRIITHYEEVFARPLSAALNLVAVCKEAKKKYFALLRHAAHESLFAWTLAVAAHLDKLLVTLQSKYDYNPVFDKMLHHTMTGGAPQYLDPSSACDAVCKAFIQVTSAVRRFEPEIFDLDMDALFWKPFGRQFIGILIGHLRRYPISVEGSRQLMRDLQEYHHVTALMNSAETSDMITCVEEICGVFQVSSESVVAVVTEDLRHLDTSVVLGLTKMRTDFNNHMLGGGLSPWAKALSAKYLNYKWDVALPWEGRKPMTIMAFKDSIHQLHASTNLALGPKTLRRSGAALPHVYINESRQRRQQKQGLLSSPRLADGRIMSLNVAALADGGNIDQHIRQAELFRSPIGSGRDGERISSRFLPSRPDEATTNNNSHSGMKGLMSPSNLNTGANNGAGSVSRPDLIGMRQRSSGTSIDRTPIKGAAATFLSMGSPPPSSHGNRSYSTSAATGPMAGRQSFSSSNGGSSSSNGNGEAKKQLQQPAAGKKNVFEKMTGFFTGKS